MKDWEKVKEKNEERSGRLNLPDFRSRSKVFIFDQYCPYSLDVINIEEAFESVKFGMHGTWAAQVIKIIAGDTVKFYGSGYTSDFDKIVDYCIENNIRVINSSIICSYSKEKEAALQKFAEWGGIWVSSAGNNDDRGVRFPASSKYTIAVSATNSEDCNGPEIDITTDSYWYVRNLNEGYFTSFNGTSCAAPVITGVVRLILDARPHWKLEEVRSFLKENSTTDMKSLEEYERFFSFPDDFVKGEDESMSRFKQYTVEQYLEVLKNTNIVRDIKEIHLHHTWKPTIKDYMQLENKEDAIWSMWRYHTEVNGWQDIGQNLTVAPDETIWTGRDVNIDPASIKGRNTGAYAIEMIGNFDIGHDKLEDGYLDAVIKLLKGLFEIFKGAKLVFHREYSAKTCPGTSIDKEVLLKMIEGTNDIDLTNVSEWAKDSWIKAVNKGINDGKGPKNNITEEQLMVFFDRLRLLD